MTHVVTADCIGGGEGVTDFIDLNVDRAKELKASSGSITAKQGPLEGPGCGGRKHERPCRVG